MQRADNALYKRNEAFCGLSPRTQQRQHAIPHREIYEHRDFAIASECKNPLLPVHRALPSPSLPTRKLQEVPATVMLANTFARDD